MVLSPPGTTRPSTPRRSSAVRTSTGVAPAARNASQCAAKSPWRAKTPILTSSGKSLPASNLHELRFGHLRDLQARHGLAQFFACFEQLDWILVVSRCLYDGFRPPLRI